MQMARIGRRRYAAVVNQEQRNTGTAKVGVALPGVWRRRGSRTGLYSRLGCRHSLPDAEVAASKGIGRAGGLEWDGEVEVDGWLIKFHR